jgi:hypothetical protein
MTHGIIALVFRCHVVDGTLQPTPEGQRGHLADLRRRARAYECRLRDPASRRDRGPRGRSCSPHTTARICAPTSRHDLDRSLPHRRSLSG